MEKIKGSKNIDLKKLLIAWIAGVLVLVPTRIYQVFNIINHEHGFYAKTDFSVWLMYIVIAILAIFFIVCSFLSSKATVKDDAFSGNKILGFSAIVVAISMIADVLTKGATFLELYKGYGSQFGVTTMKLGEYMMKSGALSNLGEVIFGLATAVFFALLGASCFVENIKASNLKILAITPVIWTIFRMLTKLIRTISYIKVSDLFYEIIMLLFMMLFFMAFAQLTSKVNEKGIEWKVYGYGFFAAIMALVCFIPRVVFVLSGGMTLSPDAGINVWDFCIAIFIVIYLTSNLKNKNPQVEE